MDKKISQSDNSAVIELTVNRHMSFKENFEAFSISSGFPLTKDGNINYESNGNRCVLVSIELENGSDIGYVPAEYCEEMAALMDDRMPYMAEIREIFTQGTYPIPVIHALFFSADSDYARQNQPVEDFDSFWETLFGE